MVRFDLIGKCLVLGGIAGLLLALLPPREARAQATLCFPPRVPLPKYVAVEERDKETPAAWAERILASKAAINYLCGKFERSSLENRQEIVRVACLLVSDKRVNFESSQDYCLKISVKAEKPQVALILCQSLVGYLALESKRQIEDESKKLTEEMTKVEQVLRIQEKDLASSLWKQLAIDSEPVGPEEHQAAAAELMEFQMKVLDYRELLASRFYGEVQATADQPAFSVLEPAYLVTPTFSWARNLALGCLAGLGLGIALSLWRNRSEKRMALPPVAREPWTVRRSTVK